MTSSNPPPESSGGHQLRFSVLPQPNYTTCGPTCLHAVYRYWDYETPLQDVIDTVEPLPEGGTLAVRLAIHALRRGFRAEIFTYNLQIFDPTWFSPAPRAARVDLAQRLSEQRQHKRSEKLALATENYLEFLSLGGNLRYENLDARLLRRFLRRGIPVLTGLSATYLYDCAREFNDDYDDIRGAPSGHFVVLSGYDPATREVSVADPLHDNPRFGSQYYRVGMGRLTASILLGILTYDANLLVITPRKMPKRDADEKTLTLP
ncbi:MAG: C39 family peptidase [Deltaproteobacteria bacterium]